MTQDDLSRLLEFDGPLPEFQFDGISEDSRCIRQGMVFVAVEGVVQDGHQFIESAIEAGAVAIIGNRKGISSICGRPYVYVENPRHAAGRIAHTLAGEPSTAMCVIGITGTNGKTSTSFMVREILNTAGYRAAVLGTLGYNFGDGFHDLAHTTPFGEELAQFFRAARDRQCTHVVMEVSSHALAQDRTAGIDFNIGAFTNLTQDHLDYHGTMEAYLQAKLKLFALVSCGIEKGLPGPRFGVVNSEDPHSAAFQSLLPGCCYLYGQGGHLWAESLTLDFLGTTFQMVTPWGKQKVRINLPGKHNVLNALCAASITGGLGIPIEQIAAGLASLKSVPGRFEPVNLGQPFQVIVDYAHTEDGLRNALLAAKATGCQRILVVFGCGGDRDKGKRPKMGFVAAEYADFIIVTSDNPRTEDPYRILLDIEVGLQRAKKEKGKDYLVIESRREAIQKAISLAQPGDLVLIAGKGHETYQIVGKEKHHFDDREEASNAIKDIFT